MYHHSFLFIVISDSRQIEEALQQTAPLEDCDYVFQTVPCVKDAVNHNKPDAALIYDSTGRTEIPQVPKEYEESILIVKNGDSCLTDPAAVSAFSEIWPMPQQEEGSKELLPVYFERLARRMKQRADARKQGICFNTLINSVPDISWFKDTLGAHLIVNDSFCKMVGKEKSKIYKKGHCYIWNASKEDEEVCLDSDRIIMDSRTTNIFEEDIKTRENFRRLKSYKSALVDVDGEVFGTCGIAYDITEQQNMRTELDILLDSVPFAVLVEDTEDIVMSKNVRFDKYFPSYADILGKSSKEWKQSLNMKLLMDDRIMEVVLQSDEEEKILIYEEEPVYDIFKNVTGRIVTLMDITLEWSISQQNEHTANTDYLTGLHNRRNLMHYLENIYTKDAEVNVTLVMADLDNFKQVNDTYGHKAGDRALVGMAELLQECFPEDFVSRMGGDEFMIVVIGKEMEEVKRNSYFFQDRLRQEFRQQEELCKVTASIGVVSSADVPKRYHNISDLLKLVDDLLYKAKKSGKNCCCVYGEE